MYFLNGERIYIKPEKACGTLDEQVENCIQRLGRSNSHKKVFKLNFFVDANKDEIYLQLNKQIHAKVAEQLGDDIIVNLIAQPPLTCRIIVEAFYFDKISWQSEFVTNNGTNAVLFRKKDTKILVGNVQADTGKGCEKDSSEVFQKLG